MDVGARMHDRIRRSASFVRHFLIDVDDDPAAGVYYLPVLGSKVLAEHKGRLFRNQSVKRVGVLGGGRASQAVQAAGSIAAPGNVSPARSPVRSGISRALTPGGGRGRGGLPQKPERGYRCPEGFQFGGRFTDENFTTCGKQLFDIPSLRETLAQAVYRTRGNRSSTSAAPVRSADVRTVEGGAGDATNELMVQRAANVPRVGSEDNKARSEGISQAVEAVANQDADSGVLVRRDGFLMVPVVSASELRDVPDNRNMEEAAYVMSARSADQLGGDELKFLSNTGVTSLVYVTPNGVQLRLDRKRDLSTGERRQLGKDVANAQKQDVSTDPTAKLKFISESTDGAFELSQDLGDVKDGDETVASGKNKGMPKWAVGAFVEQPDERVESAPEGDDDQDAPEADAPGVDVEQAADAIEQEGAVAPDTEERIATVKGAVEHLNNGGLLSALDPSVVMEALKRSDRYSDRKLRDDVTLFESEDGRRIILKEDNQDFEHLGAHFSSEMLRNLGVQAPAVKFAGEGDDKPFAYRSPDGVIEGATVDRNLTPADLPPERILGVQISDWLTDTRDRSPASILGVRSDEDQEEVDLVAAIGPPSALVGLSAEELEARRNIELPAFLEATQNSYGQSFAEAEEEQRNILIEVINALIERAGEFDWDEYRQKLAVDGTLSEGEERHLSIVKALFDNRLEVLSNSRDSLLAILGIQ